MLSLKNANPSFPPSASDLSFSTEPMNPGQYPRLFTVVTNGGISQATEIDGPQVDTLIANLTAWRAVNPDPLSPQAGLVAGSIL